LIEKLYGNNHNSSTFLLTGENLSEIENSTFEMIASYSVLHYIPDYINAIKEMARVLKVGGIIYLDHNASPEYWNSNPNLNLLKKRYPKPSKTIVSKLLSWERYVSRYRKFQNPKWQKEGDIHVWEDDHIEWDRIDKLLEDINFTKIHCVDYLAYQPHYPTDEYNKFSKLCSDTRCCIYRKQ
jgi:SAM-dependent methyltransferase